MPTVTISYRPSLHKPPLNIEIGPEYEGASDPVRLAIAVTRAALTGADLRGADLSRAVLSGVPIVPHIDAAILAAIEAGGTLDMGDWHTCETTHCRAGWAITLAGEAGAKLETQFGPAAAGALIYAASRPGKLIPDFCATDEDALADLRACAAAADAAIAKSQA